jgi:hypothetical protein
MRDEMMASDFFFFLLSINKQKQEMKESRAPFTRWLVVYQRPDEPFYTITQLNLYILRQITDVV